MEINRTFLKKMDYVLLHHEPDFLKAPLAKFNYIIANPPFSKNQDIDHIRKMYNHLEPEGRMISIASAHWKLSQNKKETEFREWLEEKGADIEPIKPGSFKDSGTMIGGFIITIDK